MAGGNPVFDRLNKQIEKERYAGFGTPQHGQSAQGQQATQAATTGYAAQDAMTAQQLDELYARQSAGPADTGRVTVDDVIVKSLTLFVVNVNAKTRRMFFFAIVGYGIFSLLQVVLLMTGVISGWGFGGSGGLGLVLSVIGVGLASYSLAIDFDSIDHAVQV